MWFFAEVLGAWMSNLTVTVADDAARRRGRFAHKIFTAVIVLGVAICLYFAFTSADV